MNEELWDVIVIGAGPAGALTALLLARSGLRVLLVEKKAFPRAKICGGCINPRAVLSLKRCGLLPSIIQADAIELSGFSLTDGHRKIRAPLEGGIALARDRFDALLVDAAVDAGAEFLPETTATLEGVSMDFRTVRLTSGSFSQTANAKVVIAANGIGRSLKGSPTTYSPAKKNPYIGAGVTVSVDHISIPLGIIRMNTNRHGYLGAVNIGNNSLLLAAAVSPANIKSFGSIGKAIAEMVEGQVDLERLNMEYLDWQGTPALNQQASRIATTRYFAVGDAAGFIEPFTGEGISWALRSAELIAPLAQQAVRSWDERLSETWESLHRSEIGVQHQRCHLITSLIRRQMFRTGLYAMARAQILPRKMLVRALHGTLHSDGNHHV